MAWRGSIRYACLTLWVLCLSLWALSYFDYVGLLHQRGSGAGTGAVVEDGTLMVVSGAAGFGPGWNPIWMARSPGTPPMLRLFGNNVLGFGVWHPQDTAYWSVSMPLWFPTTCFGLASWIAWRKTHKPTLGFPVEPLVSQQKTVGE